MASHAKQQYFADEESIQKQAREFSLVDEVKDKIDSIEYWAQVNVIEVVKENGVPLEIVDKAVDVEVPLVIDNLYTIDSENSLSAKQWKILYDLIHNIETRGRYLSNWNAATWLAVTNPTENPYTYRAWDYYVVSNVAAQGGTNYRPEPGSYTIWQASVTPETSVVKVTDMYLYDGTNWNLLINSTREIAIDPALSTTSTNPVENRVVTNAINTKQDILIAWSNIQIAADGKTISATDTTYSAGTNVSIDSNNVISATDTTYTAWANVNIDANNVISATDTVYTAWTGIDITNNVISNTQTSAEWWNITWDIQDQTDLQQEFATKQDKFHTTDSSAPSNPSEWDEWYDTTNDVLKVYDWTNWIETGKTYTAWTNIQISNANVISATDTTYTAGTNVQISAGNVISATDTTYTAWDGIAISAQNVISNTRKSVTVSSTAPANPDAWDLWYSTTKNAMYIYNGSSWVLIGPEITPITKAAYDALSTAEKNDWRFFLITDNDWTIYVDWENVQNRPEFQIEFYTVSSSAPSNPSEWDQWYDTTNDILKVYDWTNWIATWKTYAAWDGIDIDWSNNISVDVTDIIGTWLSEDASNNIIVDTTVVATQTDLTWKQDKATSWSWAPSTTPTYVWQVYIDTTNDNMYVATWTSSSSDWTAVDTNTTYTAWDWIDITNDEISVDVTDIISTWLSEDANNNIIVDYDTVAQALAWNWLEYNSWSSAIDVDYDTVWQALAWTWLTYNGWDEEIQIDTTVVATQTDLSSKQDTLIAWTNIQIANDGKTISATDTTYTAWTWLTLSGTQFSADTTVLATKSDIANLSSFEVVDTLPSASTASTKTIYLLWPIGTWADKYEEWIITNPTIADTVTISSSSTSATISDEVEITASDISITRASWFILAYYIDVYQGWSVLFSYSDGWVPSWLLDANWNPVASITIPAWTISASDFSTITSISIKVGEHTEKTWTKIWETSIDLSGYALDSNVNTKTFTLSSTSDLDTVRSAIAWKNAWKNPIISYNGYQYITGSYSSWSSWVLYATKLDTSVSWATQNKMTINYDLWSVTGITISSDAVSSWATWDMEYADFNWASKTWATITLDLNSTITPSANFTVNAPSTIKDWQVYVLRVDNWATAYTMTLGTNITNPYSTSTTLTANWIDQFVFLAIWGNLELQPEVSWGWIYTAWTWININNNEISNTGVISVNNNTWAVTVNEVPSSWTTGYVLTKTANWYWWATPAATGITNNTTWTTSSITQMRVWTEAEYQALSSYSDSILYFTTDS